MSVISRRLIKPYPGKTELVMSRVKRFSDIQKKIEDFVNSLLSLDYPGQIHFFFLRNHDKLALDVAEKWQNNINIEFIKEHEGAGVYENYIRLSIGIEHINDIIHDLDNALKSM